MEDDASGHVYVRPRRFILNLTAYLGLDDTIQGGIINIKLLLGVTGYLGPPVRGTSKYQLPRTLNNNRTCSKLKIERHHSVTIG